MGSYHSKRLASQPTPKNILDLPPEAILCIADFLPIHSVATFSLCNRRLGRLLGPLCWEPLRQRNHEARIEFLCALAKDLPGYFVCHICSLLHMSSRIPPPRPTGLELPSKTLLCVKRDATLSHRTPCSPYALKFAHIQLAMKRHHYGRDHGVSLDSLSYVEVEKRDYKEYCRTTILSVDTRIAADELLMRSQQCIVLPTDRRDKFLSGLILVQTLCKHIWAGQNDDILRRLVECSLGHLDSVRICSTCMGTFQCQHCYMDFQISIKDIGMRGTVLVVTKWINLGAGLTPCDKKWLSHHAKGNFPISFYPGSIRSSFEDQKGSSADELARANINKLFSKLEEMRRYSGTADYILLTDCQEP